MASQWDARGRGLCQPQAILHESLHSLPFAPRAQLHAPGRRRGHINIKNFPRPCRRRPSHPLALSGCASPRFRFGSFTRAMPFAPALMRRDAALSANTSPASHGNRDAGGLVTAGHRPRRNAATGRFSLAAVSLPDGLATASHRQKRVPGSPAWSVDDAGIWQNQLRASLPQPNPGRLGLRDPNNKDGSLGHPSSSPQSPVLRTKVASTCPDG
jgi:hypothetical protein